MTLRYDSLEELESSVSPDIKKLMHPERGVPQSTYSLDKARGSVIPQPKPEKPPVWKMSEDELAKCFDDMATLTGWTWCGFRPARQKIDGQEVYRTPVVGQKGLPDRVLARDGVVLLVEFKTDDGRLSEGQVIWGKALAKFPGYHIVRPRDWFDGTVERILK
jgi:hypothetical protein